MFDARDIKANDLVLALSAGGYDGTEDAEAYSDLSFTVQTPNDKKTNVYNNGVSETKMQISAMVASSEKAVTGELTHDEYFALKEEYETVDLSVLRPRDQYIQQANLDLVKANFDEVTAILDGVPASVNEYSETLNTLAELDDVTAESIAAVEAAKAAYEQTAAYVKYLEGAELEEAEELIAALDETWLVRGKLHLQIAAYEAATAVFEEEPFDATAEQIYAAEAAKADIAVENLDGIAAADKAAFLARIEACDDMVQVARIANAYDVENHKIELYAETIGQLGVDSAIEAFEDALAARPTLMTDDVLPDDAKILADLLAEADDLFGEKINSVLGAWHTAYGAKTDLLTDLAGLTQQKIDDAKAVAYDAEDYEVLAGIASEIACDLSEIEAKLFECDRKVTAASVRLVLVIYNSAAQGEIADAAALDAAYAKYLAVGESDLAGLSEDELTAYNAMKTAADTAYETKATALINNALGEFEAAVAVEELSDLEAIRVAKEKRALVPDRKYLIVEADKTAAETRYETANTKLMDEPLYYIDHSGTSWTVSETEQGIRLDNKLGEASNCDGLAYMQDPLDIDGFDFAFDFTKIGRVWKGEDPIGSGLYPSSLYVLNILNEVGKNKDEAQGFSVYFYLNHMNQIEVMVYGASRDDSPLGQGIIDNVPVTADPYEPITVRVRVEKKASAYSLWINSLNINIYYRDFINLGDDKQAHMPEFGVGEEIGDKIYRDGKAYVSFVVFGNSLAPEERDSAITIRMIGDTAFGGYVAPVYTVSVDLVSISAKTEYKKGEAFDKTGIKMTATLSDGTTVDIPMDKIRVLGFASTSKGKKKVTLSYTDDSGVTMQKVVEVTVVDAEPVVEEEKGCNGSIGIAGGAAAAAALLGAAAVMLAKKKSRD